MTPYEPDRRSESLYAESQTASARKREYEHMKATHLLGRIIFGGYFLYNGINHFRNRTMLAQYAGSKKVPQPEIAVPASGVLLVIGGISMISGYQPKVGAAALVGFLAGVSPVMHDFWRYDDPGQRQGEMINFTKNLALIGAALALTGVEEPWPISLTPEEPSLLAKAVDKVEAVVDKARSLVPVG
jgi:uncharacterized membrane protein YphA (DoxX/SURF4 family)